MPPGSKPLLGRRLAKQVVLGTVSDMSHEASISSMPPSSNLTMTSAAAAFTLGVTQDTIREWVLAGKLAAMSPGEFPLVAADSVGALLADK